MSCNCVVYVPEHISTQCPLLIHFVSPDTERGVHVERHPPRCNKRRSEEFKTEVFFCFFLSFHSFTSVFSIKSTKINADEAL